MNWGKWFQGLIVALSNGAMTVVAALVVLPVRPDWWQIFVIAGAPMLLDRKSVV
jgi:hypothetical protein